ALVLSTRYLRCAPERPVQGAVRPADDARGFLSQPAGSHQRQLGGRAEGTARQGIGQPVSQRRRFLAAAVPANPAGWLSHADRAWQQRRMGARRQQFATLLAQRQWLRRRRRGGSQWPGAPAAA